MNLFFIVVFALYFLLLLLLMGGWQTSLIKKPASFFNKKLNYFDITVIIPFRNEEMAIARTIQDLTQQSYPADHFEIMLVDDHSTDASAEVAAKTISGLPNFRMLSLPTGTAGKKKAITHAIEHARGEIIVTTDADCRLPIHWLLLINDFFHSDQVKMVSGGVRIEGEDRFFSKLQAIESSSLIGTGAATLSIGLPTMCNGANLAFLKSAFISVRGYEGNFEVPSGDDEFLMHKIHRRFPGSIYFLSSPGAVVSTRPQNSLREFIDQRLRWAGKWKHNPSLTARLLAVFILLFQITFPALLIFTVLHKIDLRLALTLTGTKLVLEAIFLFQLGLFLNLRWRTFHFLVLQCCYPFYVILMGLASHFVGYEWKGRKGGP